MIRSCERVDRIRSSTSRQVTKLAAYTYIKAPFPVARLAGLEIKKVNSVLSTCFAGIVCLVLAGPAHEQSLPPCRGDASG